MLAFEERYAVDPGSGCWVWTRARTLGGYGLMRHPVRGVQATAHRIAWERAHGAIPAGVHVHHRCGNRACVNVEHLELLEPRAHSRLAPHVKLTLERARQIVAEVRAGGRLRKEVAASHGVSPQIVSDILAGRHWPEATA